MLEHKVFAEGVAKDIKEYLPPDYADVECTVMEKSKNNGTVMVGLALGNRMCRLPLFFMWNRTMRKSVRENQSVK